MDTLLRRLRGLGYDRRSVVALGVIAAVCTTVAINWRHLIDPSLGVDWLLTGIWAFMVGLLVWRVDPARDIKLVIVGLIGGAVIEWWGTQTNLWVYFTLERPPLWILPAWPIAALAIDRLTTLVDRLAPWLARLSRAYWLVVPAFVVAMSRFLWPTIDTTASKVVVALMVGVTLLGARPRRDFVAFLAGAGLGIFLEYWGTSRHCWTYYTGQVPPVEAVFAHGFATIAFSRAVQVIDGLIPGAAAAPQASESPQPEPVRRAR